MEERVEISLMLDIYGDLLTEKQKKIMTLYYEEDLSLSEISEITNTSRQAIHDILKRCHNLLYDYEEKLFLLKKSYILNKNKNYIISKIKDLKEIIENKVALEILTDIEEKVSKDLGGQAWLLKD